MKTWVRKTINVGVLAAGAILLTAGSASASVQSASDNSGVGTGNNGIAAGQLSGNFCGNGGGGLGGGLGVSDTCVSWADQDVTPVVQTTHNNSGILSGNQGAAVGQIAANVCGNGVGIAGAGVGVSDLCAAGADQGEDMGMPMAAPVKTAKHGKISPAKLAKAAKSGKRESATEGYGHGAGGMQVSHGNSGLLTGNNVYIPVNLALNGCGNGVGILGGGVGISDSCVAVANQEGGVNQMSSDNSGVGTGQNVYVPVNVALNVCGNGVGGGGFGLGISDFCGAFADQGGNGGHHYAKKTESLPLVGDLPLGGLTGGGLPGGDMVGKLPVVGGLVPANLNSGQNGVDVAGLPVGDLGVGDVAADEMTEGKKAKKGHKATKAAKPAKAAKATKVTKAAPAAKAGTARHGGPTWQISDSNSGVLTGNNIIAKLNIAGNVNGNGVGVLGAGGGVSDTGVAVADQA